MIDIQDDEVKVFEDPFVVVEPMFEKKIAPKVNSKSNLEAVISEAIQS